MTTLVAPTKISLLLIVVGFTMLPLTNARAEIKAGTGVKDITLAGTEFFREKPGMHDPLFARALVLDDGKNRVAIVGMDTCLPGGGWAYASGHGQFRERKDGQLRGRTAGQLRGRIRQELGFEHVLINASHAHSDGRGAERGVVSPG
ncbi:MAG: hypothetical protein AMS16_00550 [Planctomycetes bacterium DG_58]|nr:MAG: hypothetical protein AMS16_00550 [Planctomycetes bacterium DG_58]KPK49866.1 MAG: hypothetical protein AMK72_03490 [Planctomycetes bacterium SM23_25]